MMPTLCHTLHHPCLIEFSVRQMNIGQHQLITMALCDPNEINLRLVGENGFKTE